MAWSVIGAKGMMQSLSSTLYLAIVYLISCAIAGYIQASVVHWLGDEDIEPTLDPMAYIDPVGFVAAIFFYIGWWKVLPINTSVAYRYRFPHLVLLLMFGIRAIAHFVISGFAYFCISAIFGSMALFQMSAIIASLTAAKRVLFLLLTFLFFFNIIQTLFQALVAITETIIIAASGNQPEEWRLSDHLILILFPLLMLFLFGDVMIDKLVKFFVIMEQGIRIIFGLSIGKMA